MAKTIPWNVKSSASYVLVLFILLMWITPQNIFARDPYPTKPRVINMVTPERIDTDSPTDPETMIGLNGKKADIISWSCYDGITQNTQGASRYIFFKDLGTNEVYSEEQAEQKRQSVCLPQRANFTQIRPPYLKNNVTTPECLNSPKYPYDPNCYSWPIGQFLGNHPKAAKGGSYWATPLVYDAQHGVPNLCGPNRDQACDSSCIYTPYPQSLKNEFITLKAGMKECVAPPYTSTENSNWWNWLAAQIGGMQPGILAKTPNAVEVFLGIDGEGRPIKSETAWVAQGINLTARFNSEYVPAVIAKVKSLYQGKTIRGMTDESQKDLYLNNDIDFHRESLASDEVNAYLYKGLSFGWWQGFANYYWITNTLGLGQGWPPYYISMLSALSKHTDGTTGIYVSDGTYMNGEGTFLRFVGDYMGKDINNTPGVWINLRDTMVRRNECFNDYNRRDATVDPNCTTYGSFYSYANNFSGKYGDYDYFLYRPEKLDLNHTVKVKASDVFAVNPAVKNQIYHYGLPGGPYPRPPADQFIGRKVASGSRYLSFDIDDGYRYTAKTGVAFNVRIVYFDQGLDTFKFQYKNQTDDLKEVLVTKTGTNLWQEKRFTISDAFFNNSMNNNTQGITNGAIYPTDFRLDFGNPVVQTVINLVEIKGPTELINETRPKAQVSCDLIRSEADNPLFGISSVKVGEIIKVKATLFNTQRQPLSNQRILITYNTEWGLAKTALTNSAGIAYVDLNTANNTESSGFVGADGSSRPDKPSQYSIQVYYPGNINYQPSRNDCLMMVTNSLGLNDPNNTRLEITSIDENVSPPKITYKVWYGTNFSPGNPGTLLFTKTISLEKKDGFYPDDPNSQTVNIYWSGIDDNPTRTHHASTNNVTLHQAPPTPPFTDQVSLTKGWNSITLPHPNFQLTTNSLPSPCVKLSQKPVGRFLSFNKNFIQASNLIENSKYNIFCSQNVAW